MNDWMNGICVSRLTDQAENIKLNLYFDTGVIMGQIIIYLEEEIEKSGGGGKIFSIIKKVNGLLNLFQNSEFTAG